MADLIKEPGFKVEGVPMWQLLNSAYAEVRRRAGVRSKRSLDSKMDETLSRRHQEIRGRR
jgi:hypothetical protein